MYLCLRGGDEHRDLKYSQFEFGLIDNPEKMSEKIEILEYTEHGSKNRPESMHQVHLNNKVVIHYAKSVLGEKCLVYIMKKYMSKLPDKATEREYFHCRPNLPGKGLPWYYAAPIGHNMLKKKLKDMFVSAGLTEDINSISNHSLRATGISWIYENGVPEKAYNEAQWSLEHAGN